MENNRKIAAVTGASRGIGAATAIALGKSGFAVAVLKDLHGIERVVLGKRC